MDDFATGYIAGQGDNNNSSNGMWGDGGWIFGIIILAMVFGWGRGGFGGFGGGGASTDPGLQGLATRADVNEAIAFNGVERGISAIQQGICDSTYALNNSITSGFNNTNVALLQGFILDFLTQSKIDSLQAENQSLKLAASQANQNSYLTATLDAQTSELIRRINPMPVPAYQVPAPYPYCGAYNNGCGCGC